MEEESNVKTSLMYIINWERKVLRQVFQMTWNSVTQLQGCFLYLSHLPEEVIIKLSEIVFFKITSITLQKRNICIGIWLQALLTYYPDL